jgi:hypothetical protein
MPYRSGIFVKLRLKKSFKRQNMITLSHIKMRLYRDFMPKKQLIKRKSKRLYRHMNDNVVIYGEFSNQKKCGYLLLFHKKHPRKVKKLTFRG